MRREGRIHYAVLALRVGYSPEYFRRAILPSIIEMVHCIEKDGQYIVWTCEDGLSPEEQQVLEARPVEG